MLLVVERLRKFCDVMLRMVDLLMRMRRALCWMHLEAICRLCSSLDFPTMLAMALNFAVMGNFLGLSFLWVIPVELSLWTGQTETWLILCLPALPGKNRSNRFPTCISIFMQRCRPGFLVSTKQFYSKPPRLPQQLIPTTFWSEVHAFQ